MEPVKFGIYLHLREGKVVRVNSLYWTPPEKDWIQLTAEVNLTLLKVRELVRDKKLFPEPDKVQWG